jgi:hypothetical protein
VARQGYARAVVAAAGPFVTDSWALDRSRQDRRAVAEVRFPGWSPASWEFVVLTKTERLVRSEPFRSLHRRTVAALEVVGDVGTLAGDELREVLVDDPRVPPPFRGHRASHDGLPGARVEDDGGRRTRMESPGAEARALRLADDLVQVRP